MGRQYSRVEAYGVVHERGGTMGFLDKVKEQANSLASTVNEQVAKGQQQLDQSQSRKAGDALLRDLGALVFATESGRATETTAGEIDRVTEALRAHEAAGSELDLSVRTGAAAGVAGASAPPAPGAPPQAPPAPGTMAPPPPAAATPPPPTAPSVAPPPPPAGIQPPPPPGQVGGA